MDPEAIRELFAALGPIHTRRMFGGQGIYRGERVFSIEIGGELYMKADADTIELFRAAGSKPFSYARKDGKVATMGYWLLPEAALDEPDQAARWARLALEASERAASPRKSRRR